MNKEAPGPNKKIIKKEYVLTSNKNRSFKIELTNSIDLLIIHAFYEKNLIKEEYIKEYNLEELKKIKFFSLFSTIDEIFEEIIEIFSKKLNSIKLLEETNQLIISLPFESVNIKEILLVLNSKTKNNEDKFNELYNIINHLRNENDNLKLEIKELKICPHPIGAVYTQYPFCKEPKELWNNTKWELLNYNGAFFRSTGGNSEEFGKLQKEGIPNITGNKLLGWTDYTGGGIIMNGGTNDNKSALFSYQDSKYYSFYYQSNKYTKDTEQHHNILGFNANRVNSIYGASEHITPENYAIKIWKRTG